MEYFEKILNEDDQNTLINYENQFKKSLEDELDIQENLENLIYMDFFLLSSIVIVMEVFLLMMQNNF